MMIKLLLENCLLYLMQGDKKRKKIRLKSIL